MSQYRGSTADLFEANPSRSQRALDQGPGTFGRDPAHDAGPWRGPREADWLRSLLRGAGLVPVLPDWVGTFRPTGSGGDPPQRPDPATPSDEDDPAWGVERPAGWLD